MPQKAFQRRALLCEALESRKLMAADILPGSSRSPFFNIQNPRDVNSDGVVTAFDALAVINDLNKNGARRLNSPATASGGEAQPGDAKFKYVDVNNDNRVTAMDALSIINRLNAGGGAGEPLVRLSIDIVAAGTNTPITQIAKGGFYEMRILTKDLGALQYGAEQRDEVLGVYTAYTDVVFDTFKTNVQISDKQRIAFGNAPSGGTFRLTVNDGGTPKTTAAITYSSSPFATRKNIEDALNTTLGSTAVEVFYDGTPDTVNFSVRFINRLSNQDVPDMTVANNSLDNGGTVVVSELIKGDVNSFTAYADALLLRDRYDASGFPINNPLYYPALREGARMATGIDNIGGGGPNDTLVPRTATVELARVRMTASEGGLVNFALSLDDIPDVLGVGLHGFNSPITYDLVEVVGDTLNITEPLSAVDDAVAINEGSVAPITIDVTANDINNAPTPNTAKTLVSIIAGPSIGSATIVGNTIRYTPPGGDFNGEVTFTYLVRDQATPTANTDVGTVTVTVNAVNDAPTLTGPNSQTFNEDTIRVFNSVNGNQISLGDVDSGTGLLTLSLSVGAGNGFLALGNTIGLTNITGNGSSLISAQGTATDLHNALQGLTYSPVLDSNGTKTLAITVNDNGNTGSGGALQATKNITLNITPINDGPTVTVGFAGDPLVVEGDPLTFSSGEGRQITVSDPDSGAGNVVVTLSTDEPGTIIHVPASAGVSIGTNDSNQVTLTGQVDAVSTALNGFTVTPQIGTGGDNIILTVAINDQGNTGGGPLADSESITIVVDPSIRPAAKDDLLTVAEDSTGTTVDVLVNDLVNLPDGAYQAILVSFDATSLHGGTIALDPGLLPDASDDKLIYTPPLNYNGPDSFNYIMDDTSPTGLPNEGTVRVTVTEVNDDPTAVNDSLTSIAEDSGNRTILANALTGNDSAGPANENGQTLTITGVANGLGGTVALVGGNVVFTPAADYNGPANFTYTITDNGTTNGVTAPKTSTATVSFTITEINDQPVVSPNPLVLAAANEDGGTRLIPIATLLAGATPGGGSDEAGQTVNLQSVTSGTGGTVAINGANVEFTPQQDFNGTASFTYTVVDNGTTNGVAAPLTRTVTVNFTVNAVNDAPVAADDAAQTGEEQARDILVLTNDYDVDASATFLPQNGVVSLGTTISIVSPPPAASGIASVVGGNAIRFTPAPGFFGTVTLQYQLNDNSTTAPTSLTSNIATVTIEVVERNDPPVASPDSGIVTDEDIAIAIDVFTNDSDPDTAQSLWTATITTPPLHGTAVFNATTRRIDYTPSQDYNGPDSFVYTINDNSPIAPTNLSSGPATVSITIREVNDAPVANPDPNTGAYTVIKDRARTFTVAELLANDTKGAANESSQTLTVTGVSTSQPGANVELLNGVITYTPPAGFLGVASFSYTIEDNGNTNGAADHKTAVGIVNVEVKDFIPTDVKGYVYIDADNDGVFDGNEKPLSGVEITLAGTSSVTGAITPITVKTNMLGYYEFPDVEPGTYTITEHSPFALRDGKETAGVGASLSSNNDVINLLLSFDGVAGEQSVNNFGERSIDTTQLTDSQGLIGEILASSTSTGFVLAADLSGDVFWSWSLNGWGGTTSIKVTLDADLSAATLECSNGLQTYTTRIYQNPYDARNANSTNPDSLARLARFRLLGHDANGNYIIRLDGKAEHFYGLGTPLAAAPVAPSGGEYVEEVDALMASWA